MSLYPILPSPHGAPFKGNASSSGDDYDLGLSLGDDSSSSLLCDEETSSSLSSWAATMGGGGPRGESSPRASPPTPLGGALCPETAKEDLVQDDLDSSSLHLVERVLRESSGAADMPPLKRNELRNSASLPSFAEMRFLREFDDVICSINGKDERPEQPEEIATKDKENHDEVVTTSKRAVDATDEDGQEGSSSSSTTEMALVGSSTPKRPQEDTFAPKEAASMRRSHSFACVTGLSQRVTGLSEMVRYAPAFDAIDESTPIQWKSHDPQAQPRRTSLKMQTSLTSTGSTASIGSSASSIGEDRPENDSPTMAPKRNVSFSNLEIYEHEVTLGDNPSVTVGPPITLEWRPHAYESHDLEEYEAARVDSRREKGQMQLPNSVRFFRLMKERGFTAVQIKRAVDEVQRAKKKRRDTVSGLKSAKLEEAMESAERKVKRFLKLKKSSKVS
mmetsp:Transcript_17705/g.51530  ORF Transcript_17705/g.51530 Transcript_17705/m.51530 type:complete len:447 (-) Transcript_17705:136-1476(-)